MSDFDPVWFDPDMTHTLHNRAAEGIPTDLLTGDPAPHKRAEAEVPETVEAARAQFDCPVLWANMSGTACAKRSQGARKRRGKPRLTGSRCRTCAAGKARVRLLKEGEQAEREERKRLKAERKASRRKGAACAQRPIQTTVSEKTGQVSFVLPGMEG